MEDKLQQLKARLARFVDLMYAAMVLSWDQETRMPSGGAAARADQIGTLQRMAHEFFTDPEIGRLLEDLTAVLPQLDPASDEASMIRVNWRDYQKRVRIPAELVGELARTSALAKQAWREAKANNAFAHFAPHLQKLVDLRIRWAECFAPFENRYDPLLDFFERGLDTQQVSAIFAGLKPELVSLVAAITKHEDAVDASVLDKPLEEERQIAFSREVTALLGYDYRRGRLDLSAHPFTTHFSTDDVRITTRIMPHNPIKALMSSIHESGHAMHSQHTSPSLYRTGLDIGTMMAIGESQSRFCENIIGRSRAFWHFLYPKFQAAFAPHFDGVGVEAMYRAVNRVEPGLIRVEADEVTYGLHIILRFELENDLINERVKVADLPGEWNARMEQYLGLTPPSDSEGVLQDIHWSQGSIGYFPDYQLGSMFAVQLWDQMQKERPNVTDEIEAGQFGNILAWLQDKVMQHGRKFTLPELAERVTGGPLHWEPYVAYIKSKFGEIYGL